MKELKRLDKYSFINAWGAVYTKCNEGWMVSNRIDAYDLVQVIIDNPTFEESIEDLLELECLV
jgi:hypothetical protein